jgi:PAS domain S-box-containing protein
VVVLAGWALDVRTLKGILPELAAMKVNTALCFLLAGAALYLQASRSATRLAAGLAAALFVVALLTLMEYGTGVDLGIDQWLFQDPATPTTLNPGRMAAPTAWSFLIAGISLLGMPWAAGHRVLSVFCRVLAGGVVAIGVFGLLAYFFGLEFLGFALPFQTIAPHTAIGLVALGAGMLALDFRPAPTEDRRIAGLAAWLLALAAGIAGAVSFTTIGKQVQDTLTQGLSFALDARLNVIVHNVALRTARAEIITSRPNLLKHLRILAANPADADAREMVQGVVDSFGPHGFSGIRITLTSGQQVAQLGSFSTPRMKTPLAGGGDRSLLWRDGMYLRNRLPLADGQGPLGEVLTEQPLPAVTEDLQTIDATWPSADFLLCRRTGPEFACFPSPQHRTPFILGAAPAGGPVRLVYRADAEGRGFANALDYRLQHVLGAFNRVGGLGLVAVLKVDAREMYAPAAQRFVLAAALVTLLALAGAWIVWRRVRPLVADLETRVRSRTADLEQANADLRRVSREQAKLEARFRQAVEASPSGMLMVDSAGKIALVNAQIEQQFGYLRQELIGEPVERLLPERFRATHPAFRADFFAQPLKRRMGVGRELHGRRRDGSEFPLEIGLSPIETAEGHLVLAAIVDITERKRLESRFRATVESAPTAIVMIDSGGAIVLVNAQTEKLFGYARQELLGRDVEQLVPQRYRGAHPQLRTGFFANPQARRMGAGRELFGLRRDGSEFPIEIGLSPIETEEGLFVLSTIVDITERKAAETAQRLSEARRLMSQVVEYSGDGIMTLTLDGKITSWNRGAERMYGYSAEEIIGQPVALLAAPGREDEDGAAIMRIARGERVERYETQRRRKDGRIISVERTLSPVLDAQGRISGISNIARDITERKRAEAALAASSAAVVASEAQLRLLLDSMQDGVFIAQDERFVLANPALPAMLGYDAGEFIGKPFAEVVAPEFLELWNDRFRQRVRGGAEPLGRYEVRLLCRQQGASLWVELNAQHLQFKGAGAVLGIARDITQRRAAEEQQRALAEGLARSNRELEDFARVASHDLQEPLRKVQAFGDLLAAQYAERLDEEARGYISRMQNAAKRMSALITDLLAFSRVTTRGQPFVKVDLGAVAAGVVSDLEVHIQQARGTVELAALPMIKADPLQMRQLLQNLISNALKYRKPDVPPMVKVHSEARPDGGEVRLFVADNGIGFDMKYLDRIFVVFQRLHGRMEYEGTGVGLAICKKIVERHGGSITATSAPGEGATFIVTLPVNPPGAEQL